MSNKKETDIEVSVQCQLDSKEKMMKIIDLVDGLKLYEWNKLKNCIDREFASQVNKITFKTTKGMEELLKLEINH